MDNLLQAYFIGILDMIRAPRKHQFGQALISVFTSYFSNDSRLSEKLIWTSYYKRILDVFQAPNSERWSRGRQKSSPGLMFYKVSAKVATGAGRHAKRLDLDKIL